MKIGPPVYSNFPNSSNWVIYGQNLFFIMGVLIISQFLKNPLPHLSILLCQLHLTFLWLQIPAILLRMASDSQNIWHIESFMFSIFDDYNISTRVATIHIYAVTLSLCRFTIFTWPLIDVNMLLDFFSIYIGTEISVQG